MWKHFVAVCLVLSLAGPGPVAASTTVLQPNETAGQDVWITSVFSYNDDYGVDDDKLQVGGWADEYRTLIRFDLSGAPAHADSATLVLQPYSPGGTSTRVSMTLYRITSGWNESVGWYSKPTSTYLANLPTPTDGVPYAVDITSLYNSWQSGGTANFGIELRPTSVSNKFNVFRSSAYSVATERPKLVITSSTSGLTAPGKLRAREVSPGNVALTWMDNSSNEVSFDVQRGATRDSLSTIKSAPADSTATGDSVPSGATRVYRVRARAADGSVAASNLCWLNAKPARPTNLEVVSRNGTTATLSWQDNSSNETGFRLQRRVTGTSTFANVATVKSGITSYGDTGLDSGTSYEYRVQAKGKPAICIPNSAWSGIARTDGSAPTTRGLAVTRTGTGSGTVVSNPGGISCGGNCSAAFPVNSTIKLTATAASGSAFKGWTGACSGTSTTCNVMMNIDKSVGAKFDSVGGGGDCPTAGPLTDLTRNCSGRRYLFVGSAGERVELTTDGDELEIVVYLFYPGEEFMHFYANVQSPTTFESTKICSTGGVCRNDAEEPGSLLSSGTVLKVTLIGGVTFTYTFVGSEPAP